MVGRRKVKGTGILQLNSGRVELGCRLSWGGSLHGIQFNISKFTLAKFIVFIVLLKKKSLTIYEVIFDFAKWGFFYFFITLLKRQSLTILIHEVFILWNAVTYQLIINYLTSGRVDFPFESQHVPES